MKQRGRKSASSNGVPPIVDGSPSRLQPPPHLSADEQRLFHEVVTSAPANQFSPSDQYLLATFCQVTVLIRSLAKEVAKANKESKQAKTKMLLEACKTQMQIATKLRLTVQSRTHPATTGRAHANRRSPSAYDLMRAGWDLDDDGR
jgi:phage terminase small subunit